MKEYYTYVYYDADWIAYYVGKGQKRRRHYRQDRILIPDDEHIQVFKFNTEWEAFECEIELIGFWKRQCDGGSLLNKTLGGLGITGLKRSKAFKIRASIARKTSPKLKAIIESCCKATRRPISLMHIETNEVRFFASVQEAARELKLNAPHISGLRHGKRKTHKGWKLND